MAQRGIRNHESVATLAVFETAALGQTRRPHRDRFYRSVPPRLSAKNIRALHRPGATVAIEPTGVVVTLRRRRRKLRCPCGGRPARPTTAPSAGGGAWT